jgi:hypothetical protein
LDEKQELVEQAMAALDVAAIETEQFTDLATEESATQKEDF